MRRYSGAFDAAVGCKVGNSGMERGLGLRGRDALPGVDRATDEDSIGDGDGRYEVPEGVAEEGLVLIAEGVGVVGPRGAMEVEEDAPGRELVSLASELGFVEEGALVVELAEGHGREDAVGGVQGVEDYVVVGGGSIDEEEIVGEVRGCEDASECAVADGPELDEVQRRGEKVDAWIDGGKDVLREAFGMEDGGDVLAVGLIRGVEVVGGRAVLDVEIGDENSVACGGGIVGDEDAERGFAGAALDRGEADSLHHLSPKNWKT